MSWNWFADRQPRRERFAGPLSIGGLVVSGLLLLVMLYPDKSLLKLLSAPEVSNRAQQQYLEALVQLRHGDTELIIPLVRSYLDAGCIEKAARALNLQQGRQSEEQSKVIMGLRYELLCQQLEWMSADEPGREDLRRRYANLVNQLQQGARHQDLARYLADARYLGETEVAERIASKLDSAVSGGIDPLSAEAVAKIAVARGDYRGAAAAYFRAMDTVSSREAKRELFLSGVRILQSGNCMEDAMAAAEKYYPRFGNDQQVLVYLTRLALAANRPDHAGKYVRKALGMTDITRGNGQTP